MTAETCDVLILGSGPSGIAAARSLLQEGKSVIVLEARSRVGGRAFTSDSLRVNFPLDHGAKWIHGGCAQNRLVQLWHVLEGTGNGNEAASQPTGGETTPGNNMNDSTPPPFDIPDSGTEYEINKKVPIANMTKILLKTGVGVVAKEPSTQARKVAKQAFNDIIQAPLNDPTKFLNSHNGGSENVLEKGSLLEFLLSCRGEGNSSIEELPYDKEHKHDLFASFCRNRLLPENANVKSALASIHSEEERKVFQEEVMALFTIEIYTFFESWEGAPIHQISTKYGLETTCLPGGNVVVPYGYGGLVQRIAQPLLDNEHVRLDHKVVSVACTPSASPDEKPEVTVRCIVSGSEEPKEFHSSACIVALPLGVLRSAIQASGENCPKFDPELPQPLCKAVLSLGISARNKIEMLFPVRWWPENVGRITIACTHMQQAPTYHPYTTFIVESAASSSDISEQTPNILVCYVAGDFARETEEKADAQIQEEVMTVLREANFDKFGKDIPDPTAFHVTRWVQDQFSRGSWSFIGKGSSPDDIRSFRENVECQSWGLFFAGEHTCSGSIPGDDMGCVHGAWVSGELAAKAALKRLVS